MNSHIRHLVPALFFTLVAAAQPTLCRAHDVSGYLGGELRGFFSDPLFPEQSDNNASLTGYLEYYHDTKKGDQRVAFTGFARVDSEDSQRTHGDIREMYWWRNFDQFELYVGARKIFWGVTESVHVVDILNQTDTLENIDGEDKLGQPMIELVSSRDWGIISAYVLPYFREREFPGEKSRLRPGVKIFDDALYQSEDEEKHVDYAFRWSHYINIWDLGISHFSGTSREPIFIPVIGEQGLLGVRPFYSQIDQTGVDIQATIEAWLWKLEVASIYEKDHGRNTAAAGGFEYTFFSIGGSNADLGIIAEYQFDDRRGIRLTTAQNDLVFGARWAFNDLDGSEILALFSQDLDYDNRFFSVELSRRLTDHWKIEAEARFFSAIEPQTPEYDLRKDDYIQIELRRYF